jgi:hypothetical protein
MFNLHGISDVRQTEMQSAEPLVHEPSHFEVKLLLKKHKSPDSNQILAELIETGGKILHF